MPDAQPATAAEKPHTLDDIMIAMDVVDTMRHRDDLVQRELNDTGREAELIERLREIYRQQGIEVPDSVLAEGVKALKDSRFTYAPQPSSWTRTAYVWWTRRSRVGAIGGAVLAVLLAAWGYHYVTVERPAELAAAETRIELTQTLPNAIHHAAEDVQRIATVEAAREKARQLAADGEHAIRDHDKAGMEKAAADLARLRADLMAEYTLTIVSRPGETTGVWRAPHANALAHNYYIVVEPISPAGQKIKIPVRNEETGETQVVDKLAVRVPQATYDAVAADKKDDGIVQNNRFGVKRRGSLEPDYLMPFGGGAITKW